MQDNVCLCLRAFGSVRAHHPQLNSHSSIMKRLSLLLMLIIPLSSIARNVPEPPDTVKLIDNPQKVVVSRTGDTTVIEVEKQTDYAKDLFTYNVTVQEADDSESSFDLEVPFGIGKDRECRKERSRLRTSVILVGHGYLGQRFNYYDKGDVKNSIEVGFREVVGIRWSRGMYGPSFSTGIGVGTQIYHARD